MFILFAFENYLKLFLKNNEIPLTLFFVQSEIISDYLLILFLTVYFSWKWQNFTPPRTGVDVLSASFPFLL